MLWHYLMSALLAIKAQGKYTLINILGLTTGLSAALVLLMIILSETGFDEHHPQANRLARVEVIFDSLDNTHIACVAGAMGPTLMQQGLVEDSARLFRQQTKLRIGQRQYLETRFVYADASAAEMLQFNVVAGDLKQALSRPFGLAITQTTARRWFGDRPALNEVVMSDAGEPLQVLAVIADLPRQTHLALDILSGMGTLESIEGRNRLESWMRNDFYTYVRLPEHRQRKELEQSVTQQLSQPLLKIVPGLKLHFELQPISDIHLHGHAINEFKVNGDITQVRVFASLMVVILFVAIFNYVNFATATAGRRAKEIGVRQVVGASRSSLMIQFMVESMLLVALAFVLASAMVLVAIPWVNEAFDQDVQLQMLLQGRWLGWALLLFVAVVIGAGFYPALILSSIPTLSALKGAGFKGKSGHWFRRIVFFMQLSSAICLAIWGGHIYAQMALIEQTPLGYDKQDKLVLTEVDSKLLMASLPALTQRLQGYRHIKAVAAAEFIPTQDHGNLVALRHTLQHNRALDNVLVNTVSTGFFQTLAIEMLAGRDFLEQEQEMTTRTERNEAIPIIINSTTMKILNLGNPKEAIGQQLELGWDPDYNQASLGRIIAVVDDYFTTSLKVEKRPMVFVTGKMTQSKSQLVLSFSRGGYLPALAQLRSLWPSLFSATLPSYQLLRSRFEGLYRQDRLRSTMVNLFNILTLMVITFGVLGLCSFSAQRRLKEFALRQLMGASTANLGWILGREFLVSVLVAWAVMLVPAWWLTDQWLAQFVTRVEIQWCLYLLVPCVLVLIISTVVAAILTVLRHVELSGVLRTE
ncbi:ABC transporter permease [Shewanella khirikhana]|uniref:FtsX-like permease family protein n=1 Tax=Shewanella khirikhana TaxID=1965282 RepID=A0ABN5TYS3_9GAMM|nr:ABC transporter permease [Shewanella khirikhana]AZQ12584.1 FtsX-like permease family protein [Shewanella khirikhana]